ncbi:MAG: hypothetical protein QG568_557 [Patescibacteria group bacterium]|nr:hypothetical protein [Patescibacteria group bacterium]
MGYYINSEGSGFNQPNQGRFEGQDAPKPIEVEPKILELQQFLGSETALKVIASLAINGALNNQDLINFEIAEEASINTIEDPKKSNQQKILLDIKKALLIGIAGDVEYAYGIISEIGQTTQLYNLDPDIEDYASAALEILGF